MTDALGMVEVRGLSTALVAANLAVNTADVTVSGFGYLHDGQVAVSLRGSVDSVRAAVDAIERRMPPGMVVTSNVIARVAEEVEPVLRERAVPVGGRVGAPKVRGRGPAYRPTSDGGADGDPAGTGGGAPAPAKRTTGRRTAATSAAAKSTGATSAAAKPATGRSAAAKPATGETAPRTRRSNPHRER